MFAFTTPSTLNTTTRHHLRQLTCPRPQPVFGRFPTQRVLMMADETDVKPAETPVASSDAQAGEDAGSAVGTVEKSEESPIVNDNDGKQGILMLCMGNICRSPAAEAVFKGLLREKNLEDKFFVDSCGTGGGSPNWYMEDGMSHHEGYPADTRMTYSAGKRGIKVDSISRPLQKEDFDRFDWIIAMDSMNVEAIDTAREHWGVENPRAKVKLLSEFSSNADFKGQGVPDPYWSRQDGFEKALDLIEESCGGLLDQLSSA